MKQVFENGRAYVLLAAFAIAAASAGPAVATMTNIDFNGFGSDQTEGTTFYGMVSEAGVGGYFNGIVVDDTSGLHSATVDANNLLDSTGTLSTGITFSTSGVGAYNEGGSATATDLLNLYKDYLYMSGATTSFTIGGLGAAGTADLYFYTRQVGITTDEQKILISDSSGTRTMIPVSVAGYDSYNTTLKIAGVNVTGGEINGMLVSGLGSLCGMTIVASVPEPSTSTMVVMGLFGLLAYAWRKRR